MTFQYGKPSPVARVFQYPKPKTDRLPEVGTSQKSEAGGQPRFYIQGKRAFKTEWNAFQGFLIVGYAADSIEFQSGFLGGRFFKGGTIADFVIPTKPFPTPVFVDGEHWHSGLESAEDIEKRARLADETAYFLNPPVVLYGGEVTSPQEAAWTIMNRIGRPA